MLKRQFEIFVYILVLVQIILHQNEVKALRSRSFAFNKFKLPHNCQAKTASAFSVEAEYIASPSSGKDKDEHYMRLALRHAQHSFREKEVPIGAVIVDSDGTVLATSRNQVETENDVTAHAELSCIRKATKIKKNWRLTGCTLYSTLEPCPMCMGAIQASRISKVVYGAPDIRMGACGSWIDLVGSKHPFHDVEVVGGLLHDESSIMLKRFFQMRRRETASSNAAAIIRDESERSGEDSAAASRDTGDNMIDTASANNLAVGNDNHSDSGINNVDRDSASSSHIDRGYLSN